MYVGGGGAFGIGLFCFLAHTHEIFWLYFVVLCRGLNCCGESQCWQCFSYTFRFIVDIWVSRLLFALELLGVCSCWGSLHNANMSWLRFVR